MDGLQVLTLTSLESLDPVAVAEWQKSLDAAVKDCADRPSEGKAREVTLVLKISPETDVTGQGIQCIGVEAEVTVKSSRPAHTRGGKSLAIYADGRCAFNPLSPHNVNQRTLPMSACDVDEE